MNIRSHWGPAEWRRAAAPAMPTVTVADGHMTSEATIHRADHVAEGKWRSDWLPGRWLNETQARNSVRIAVAPDRLEADGWAQSLGFTINEAVGLLNAVDSDQPELDWGLDR